MPPNSYLEDLKSDVAVYRMGSLMTQLKLNEVIRVGPYSSGAGVCIKRGGHTTDTHAQRKSRVRTWGIGSIHKPRKETSEETSPAGTLILGFQPPGWREVNSCGLVPRRPEQTQTSGPWLRFSLKDDLVEPPDPQTPRMEVLVPRVLSVGDRLSPRLSPPKEAALSQGALLAQSHHVIQMTTHIQSCQLHIQQTPDPLSQLRTALRGHPLQLYNFPLDHLRHLFCLDHSPNPPLPREPFQK